MKRRLFLVPVLLLGLLWLPSMPNGAADPPDPKQPDAVKVKAGDPPVPGPDSITLPKSVAANKGRIVKLEATTKGSLVRWYLGRDDADLVPMTSTTAVFSAPEEGIYKILAWSAVDGQPTPAAICTITVGTPPTPTPGPGPGPTPTPSPAPIPDQGLYVLITYESMDGLPPAQQAALTSTIVRDWLKAKAGGSGPNQHWDIFDKNDEIPESKAWAVALKKRGQKSLPWIAISKDGKSGFEGPLPASTAELMALLKKYGGD